MLDFPRWKVWSVSLIVLVGVLLAIPSLIPEAWLSRVANPERVAQINLGLDLSGGSHILLEADTADVAKQRLTLMEETVRTEMRRNEPRIEIGDISTAGGKVAFMVRNVAQLDAAMERIRELTRPIGVGGQRDWNVAVIDSTRIVLTPTSYRKG